jgi:hypothetical protein
VPGRRLAQECAQLIEICCPLKKLQSRAPRRAARSLPVAEQHRAVIFETQRLIVRPYTVDDADFVFDMYSRWEVQQLLGSAPRPLQSREGSASGYPAMARLQRLQSSVRCLGSHASRF